MVQSASQVTAERQGAIEDMISKVRDIAQSRGISCVTLEAIKAEMVSVAKRKTLFPFADFQSEEDEAGRQPMQLLHKDDDGQFALYMSTSVSDQPPPHTTTPPGRSSSGFRARSATGSLSGRTTGPCPDGAWCG